LWWETKPDEINSEIIAKFIARLTAKKIRVIKVSVKS